MGNSSFFRLKCSTCAYAVGWEKIKAILIRVSTQIITEDLQLIGKTEQLCTIFFEQGIMSCK